MKEAWKKLKSWWKNLGRRRLPVHKPPLARAVAMYHRLQAQLRTDDVRVEDMEVFAAIVLANAAANYAPRSPKQQHILMDRVARIARDFNQKEVFKVEA